MFSENIKRIRSTLGLNQSDFAKRLNISQSAISEFENGTRDPSKAFMLAIKDLGISLDWFFTGIGEIFSSNEKMTSQPFTDQNSRQKDDKSTFYRPKWPAKGQEANLELANVSSSEVGSQSQSTKDAVANTIESLVLESAAGKFNELEAKIDETFAEHNARLEKLEKAMRRYEVRQDSGQPDGAGDKAITYLGKNYSDADGLMVAEPPALYEYAHKADTVSLPLALNLAAGIPIEACDVNETYRVSKKLLKKGRRYCVAKIKGTSMTEAGIADGAFVLLEYTGEPVSGAIMVVKYGNNTTLKRLYERADGIWELLYEDGSGAKIELKEGDWEVKGKMVQVV